MDRLKALDEQLARKLAIVDTCSRHLYLLRTENYPGISPELKTEFIHHAERDFYEAILSYNNLNTFKQTLVSLHGQ